MWCWKKERWSSGRGRRQVPGKEFCHARGLGTVSKAGPIRVMEERALREWVPEEGREGCLQKEEHSPLKQEGINK